MLFTGLLLFTLTTSYAPAQTPASKPDDIVRQWFDREQAVSFLELREQLLAEHDLLVAAIRISVGVATNFTDVFRFMCFMQGFVDRRVDEIGQLEFVSDNCRIVRDSA